MRRLFCLTAAWLIASLGVVAQRYDHALERFDSEDFLGAAQELHALRIGLSPDAADYTKVLSSEGNAWNMLGNRQEIGRAALLLQQYVDTRKVDGRLTQKAADSLMYDVLKLWGDYHYENSDLDAHSYDTAAVCYTRCLDYLRRYPARGDSGLIHRELAQLYYKQEQWTKALDEMELAYQQYAQYYADDFLENVDVYFDVASQRALCLARVQRFDEALREIDEVVANYTDKQSRRYGEALRKKAKILMLRQEAEGGRASEALACYRSYFDVQRDYALRNLAAMTPAEREQYWLRLRPFVTDCYRLEAADAGFLYDVTLFAKGLLLQLTRLAAKGVTGQDAVATLAYTWQQIQQQLPKDGCAIEFVLYDKAGKKEMGALVLPKSGKPSFVALTNPDAIFGYQLYSRNVAERLASTEGSLKNALYNDTTGLRQLLWPTALLRAIGKAQRVYFAPDGYQHQIAIEYMLPEEAAAKQLYRLTSTRQLMEPAEAFDRDAALICGGVRYDAQHTGGEAGNDPQAYDYMQRLRAVFEYLPGSLIEADSILAYRHSSRDSMLIGTAATEQNFRALCSRYPVIHVSTHGYFASAKTPQGSDLKPCLSDESLSEAVIALAGSNSNLYDEQFDRGQMDGVLSARELSTLDLSRVQLFVVSACQTGLGYVTSDGVFGIQRGLKNAGVRAIVVSLWNVSDDATRMLMSSFHENLCAGLPLRQAFAAARTLFARAEQPATAEPQPDQHTLDVVRAAGAGDSYDEPEFRNAFILIDALE